MDGIKIKAVGRPQLVPDLQCLCGMGVHAGDSQLSPTRIRSTECDLGASLVIRSDYTTAAHDATASLIRNHSEWLHPC